MSETGLTGKGATVAIVDAYGSSTMLADANQYATNHGDKPFARASTPSTSPRRTGRTRRLRRRCRGWAPEESLDVEMAHGYAPDANVVYVGANSCTDQDLLAAWQTIVDNHLADVVSNSWGEIMHGPTATYFDTSIIAAVRAGASRRPRSRASASTSPPATAGTTPRRAAATGANCDPNSTEAQTEWPASDPWVTGVGGTALAISSAAGNYKFETAMGNQRSVLSPDGKSWSPFPGYWYFGGGGGTSPGLRPALVPDRRGAVLARAHADDRHRRSRTAHRVSRTWR